MQSSFSVFLLAPLAFLYAAPSFGVTLVNFEDKTLSPSSFYNGNHGTGTNSDGWTSGGTFFNNNYNSSFGGFWSGWSYSNVNNATTAGFGNQYAAYTGTGVGGSGNYGISDGTGAFINLPTSETVQSVNVTNTTYAALSMKNGDSFAKKFGGASGNDPDYFSVIFTGYDGLNGTGNVTGFAEKFLADYRSSDNAQDYIVNTWDTLDLTGLGSARSIRLTYTSSDVGTFGINTPLYVAIDNLSLLPEPAAMGLVGLGGLLFVRRKRSSV